MAGIDRLAEFNLTSTDEEEEKPSMQNADITDHLKLYEVVVLFADENLMIFCT
jgi:hypothetical protein